MTDLPKHLEDHICHICNDTFQFASGLKQHIMTHVKIIDQINNIFAKDKEFSNDFKKDYSLEERVKQTKYDVNDNDNKEASLEISNNRTSSTPKGKQYNGSFACDEIKSIVNDILDTKNAIKASNYALGDQDLIEKDRYFHSLPEESTANKVNHITTIMRFAKKDKEINSYDINETLPGHTVERTATLQSYTVDETANLQTASETGNFHQSAHSCTICYKTFTRKDSLKWHLLAQSNSKSYICDICNCHFNRKDYLGKHIRHVHLSKSVKPTSIINDPKSNEYICLVCNKQFKWKHSLIEHKIIHSDNNPHVCKICGAKFTRSSSLKEHSLVHTGERPHICLFCETKFTRVSQLNVHMRRSHSGISICNICGLRFEDVKSLSLHLKIHTEAEKNTTKIAHSKKEEKGVFSNTDNFDQHNVNNSKKPTSVIKDPKSNEYICSVCNKQFKWKHSLIEHKIIHSDNNPNVCKICGAKFTRSSSLKEHSLVHTGERPHICLFCETKFTRVSQLNVHMRRSHSGISFCNICGLRFEDVKSLSLHLKIHTEAEKKTTKIAHSKKEEKGVFSNTDNFDQHNVNNSKKPTSVIKDPKSNEYICSVCNKQFKSETSWIQHKMIHSANNPYVCNVCGAKFLNSSRLKEHTLFHTGFRSHVCHFCNSKFIRASDLNAHMRKRHSDIVTCNCCGLRFEDVKSLSLHLKIHTKAEIDLIKISYAKFNYHTCKICGKELTSLLRLKKHLQVHSGEKKYTCEICGKTATALWKLKDHLYSHCGEKRYTCEICGNRYMYKHGLLEHKKLHETKDRWHCDHCNKNYSSRSNIRTHIRVTHLEKGGTHTCNICQKSFDAKSYLKAHIRLHTRVKTHECKVCGKTCADAGNLKKHVFTHSNKQPFSCEYCEQRFKRRENLKTHMLIHSGDKPHTCVICGQKFRQRGSVKIHMRNIHNK